jgi:hypothetical protein
LAEDWRWSWLLPIGILSIGAAVAWLADSWLAGLVAFVALALAVWQYLLPVTYEICSLGVRRYTLGRMRLVPWSAIRGFQLRTNGIALFQRPDPAPIDVLNSFFLPNPPDTDDLLVAVRLYLPHATELPKK